MRITLLLCLLSSWIASQPADAGADLPPLIPREVLFGNPDKVSPEVSPDGTRLSYLAPDHGVLNVWVRTIGAEDDRPVTDDRGRGIRAYFWARNSKQIVYVQDTDGDENWHVFTTNLDTDERRDLTPFKNVAAWVIAVEPEFPDEILVAINKRSPEYHDVFRANLVTGELTLEVQNSRGFVDWMADRNLHVRGAVRVGRDGGAALMVRDTIDSPWRTLTTWDPENALGCGPLGFTPDGKGLYLISSTGSNTAELREIDIATGREKVLAGDSNTDVAGVLMHPQLRTIQAVAFVKERMSWQVLDPSITDDFSAIGGIRRGDFGLINRDYADRIWLVYFVTDDGPVYYYVYDRKSKTARFLFTHRQAVEELQLAQMAPIKFESRDGLTIHGYLTTPPGLAPKNLPLVLNVHGGPWHRDTWGCHSEVQWLANRGYAVLQVNFRGSTGYGKRFLNAGNREWGGKMHDDLIDGVNWAVQQGVADPERIAIYGGSYGGYAALVGLTFTPEVFCCGVDIVGPSNLVTWMKTVPPYWKPFEPMLFQRVGHPQEDAEFLRSRSPLFKVDQITSPLLIAQGANDPRIRAAESRQMVDKLRELGKDVEYVEYEDEGHGFARPENRLDFYARAEKFLAKHLGGRFEPIESIPLKPPPPPRVH